MTAIDAKFAQEVERVYTFLKSNNVLRYYTTLAMESHFKINSQYTLCLVRIINFKLVNLSSS